MYIYLNRELIQIETDATALDFPLPWRWGQITKISTGPARSTSGTQLYSRVIVSHWVSSGWSISYNHEYKTIYIYIISIFIYIYIYTYMYNHRSTIYVYTYPMICSHWLLDKIPFRSSWDISCRARGQENIFQGLLRERAGRTQEVAGLGVFPVWQQHKTIGKPWGNHGETMGETMGKPWGNHGETI